MADSKAKKEWIKSHTSYVGLRLNNKTDADILDRISAVPNKQGYIKALIRQDIQKDGKK